MRDSSLMAECEALAAKLGMTVRRTRTVHSTFCVIRKEKIIYIDNRDEQATVLRAFLDAFATEDCDTVFITPALRELIDRHGIASDT